MSEAATLLGVPELTGALKAEKTALEALQRAFSKSRYLLRALATRERLDMTRRLTGPLDAAAHDRRPAGAAPDDPRLATLAPQSGHGRRAWRPAVVLARRCGGGHHGWGCAAAARSGIRSDAADRNAVVGGGGSHDDQRASACRRDRSNPRSRRWPRPFAPACPACRLHRLTPARIVWLARSRMRSASEAADEADGLVARRGDWHRRARGHRSSGDRRPHGPPHGRGDSRIVCR